MTAPPCTEKVFWRIFDLPLEMSRDQSWRIRKLTLQQLDEYCNRGSNAYQQGVNRPLQKNKNKIYRCTGKNWPAEVYEKESWLNKWPKDYHGRKKMTVWKGYS